MAAPCNWTITVPCSDEWENYPLEVREAATEFATTVLWAATGRRFGLCEITVRPCGRRIEDSSLWGYWLDGQYWVPYIDTTGTWRNCACGVSRCGCEPRCEVWLPGPVESVTEVIQDGIVVDPSAYVVDNGRWLVRIDGGCWPEYADLNTDTDRFQVTYQRGTPVPGPVAVAAGILADEWAKACTGQNCRLPQRISSIARQGVTVAMVDTDSLIRRNFTGITEVDQVIFAYNPHGLFARPRVFSPDMPAPRMRS